MSDFVKLRPLNRTLPALQWRGDNEAEVRAFVKKDNNIHFNGSKLQVWNSDNESWDECPIWGWIVKAPNNSFQCISDYSKRHDYEEIIETEMNEELNVGKTVTVSTNDVDPKDLIPKGGNNVT